MNRITYRQYGNSVSTFNVTIPAGISVIFVQVMQGTSDFGYIRSLDVVPNTTYVLTIVSTAAAGAVNNPNTLGSLFSFTGGGRLEIYWTE